MYARHVYQWFREPADGRCCPDPRLELEPCYPSSADWRPRCRACGSWHRPGVVAAAPAPIEIAPVRLPLSA